MRALCWHGKGDVRVDTVPDPKIEHPRDAVIKITACAICGSDLHLLDGYQPTMESGDILGHENMGEVVELGSEVTNLKIGDRVVVPFTISCGQCWFCQRGMFSACDRTNPNAEMAIKAMGHSPAGLFGFSHMLGGYSGGQAEYLRVPMADVGPIKIPDSVSDEQALFLSDIFPTGYMAAENAQIEDGDTVAIWGCGPVGQFAIRSALMMGAGRVIAIDEVPERLAMAEAGGAETIDFSKVDVYDELMARTNNRGPDSCIDAVGCEASGHGAADAVLDKVKAVAMLATDRVHVLREAIFSCRKGGTISIPGVYVGMGDKLPIGAAMNKGLTFKMGQTHVQAYTKPLLEKIEAGEIDPSFVVTHPASLEDAPEMYKKFRDKEDGVIKVVLRRTAERTDTDSDHGTPRDLERPSRDRAARLPGRAARRRLDLRARRLPHRQPQDRPSRPPRLRRCRDRRAGRARRPGEGLRDRPRQDDRARGGGAGRGGARERQDAARRGLHPLRRGRHALLRPPLLPDPGRRGGRDRLRGDPRRAREAQGRGDRPHRALPPPARRC